MLNEKSFTLIETLVAIFVLTSGILGVLALVSKTISGVAYSRQKFIATYLAQEGIEIVRNLRDGNLLKNQEWKEGLNAGTYEVDYNDISLSSFSNRSLKLDSNGFYSYDSGTETPFQRKIILSYLSSDILEVQVEVSWKFKGKDFKVTAEGRLYNWR